MVDFVAKFIAEIYIWDTSEAVSLPCILVSLALFNTRLIPLLWNLVV